MPEPEATGPAADARPVDARPVDGRTRLLASLRRPGSRGQAVAALLLAVLGFAAVTQVRANGRNDSFVGARQSDLIQYIDSLNLASQRAQSEVAKLQRTRSALGSDTEARRTALVEARRRAVTLGILAGTVPAEGPGVRVSVTSGGTAVGTNQLLDGLQELRDAGAEVIELNDKVRVVAQTSLQDTSRGAVVVDGTTLRPPYVIDAIGDPHTLATALDFADGFVSEVESVGGKVSITQRRGPRGIDVRSVHVPTPPHYARADGSR